MYYTYTLQGTRLPAQQSIPLTGLQHPPGILSGGFYRNLTRTLFPNVVAGSVNCYELMMMHVGLVQTQYVVDHCQKLAHMMWEISGESPAPMSLF